MEDNAFVYEGNELEIFSQAHNWRAYWSSHIRDFLGLNILEVGAGIGSVSNLLITGSILHWTALEPDPELAKQLQSTLQSKIDQGVASVFCTTLSEIDPAQKYSSIIYIDVLEHIEFDEQELILASSHLEEGGKLIILVPAYQFLFSEFDQAIGHYRRYSKKVLEARIPKDLVIKKSIYLDSVGLFASLINRFFLKSSSPTLKQIQFWDKRIIPLSKLFDRVIHYKMGKSLIVITQKK